MAAVSPAVPQNGSYLQQADPQNFPANPTGFPPPNSYQAPASTQPAEPQEVPKDEVGWYFVEQYYTTLNKTPERLHLFYNKRSTMVWGTEGESLPLARGRSDIHEKIAAHEFKECKVRVSNVDSQASADNGIVIQVLGEMSNNGLPNRKFSQTFFLAEQPNGYFVLNDIFRYLKDDDEETDEYYEEEIAEAAEIAAEAVEQAAEEIIDEIQDMTLKETTTIEIEAKDDKVTIEETHTVEPVVPELETKEEGEEKQEKEEEKKEEETKEEKEKEEETIPTPAEPANGTAEQEPEPVPEETPAPEPVPTPPPAEEKPPTPAPPKEAAAPPPPRAPAPVKPKSWAALLVSTPTPGSAPAAQAAPAATPPPAQAQTPPAPAAPATPPTPATPTTPGGGSQWQTADSKRHSRMSSTPGGQTQSYVKNVTEAVTEKALREALSKYGNIKNCEIHRNRNCAFVEFDTPAAFAAANAANPHVIAGSNVLVEERRPRGSNTNNAYGRGGASGRGDGRSSGQGGRNYQSRDGQRFEGGGRGGRGRGGFQSGRGGMKTGTAN